MSTASRPGFDPDFTDLGGQDAPTADQGLRHLLGAAFLTIFFAFAPSTIPDWRADPAVRTVAVLPIGEPVVSLDRVRYR